MSDLVILDIVFACKRRSTLIFFAFMLDFIALVALVKG